MLNQLTIRPKFTIECLQHSNQQGVGYFEAKYGEKRLTNLSQTLTQSGRDTGLLYTKEIVWISSDV